MTQDKKTVSLDDLVYNEMIQREAITQLLVNLRHWRQLRFETVDLVILAALEIFVRYQGPGHPPHAP